MHATDRIEFTGSQGDRLAARLDRPVGAPPRGYAIFAHCFTCSKDLAAASRVSRELSDRGIAVLRFDFTGLGHSEGEFSNTNFSSNVQDLVLAADWLRAEHEAPALLIGHSLGGAAVLAAASEIPEARAVATIGAPADPAHVAKLFADSVGSLTTEEIPVEIGGRPFRIRRQLLEDLESQTLTAQVAKLGRALLVLHSPIDSVVGIENASTLFLAARHPKSFVSLDQADHLLSRRADAVYVAETIAAWASRYLPPRPEARSAPKAEPDEVVVEETGENRFANAIAAGPHRLRADEPPSVGGGDTGATPYGLLLASLGACTSMTLRMYAERKKLPLERVSVRLRHDKIHAKDCEECETKDGRIDRIRKEITLEGPLDAAQRERLLEIADRCPVHRTLHSEVSIESTLSG